jgi:hypothetical protein
MPSVSITLTFVDKDQWDAFVDAVALNHRWTETIETGITGELVPNPESKVAHAKRKLFEYVEDEYRGAKASEADVTREQLIEDAKIFIGTVTVS